MIKRIRFWLCHYFVLEIKQLLMCFYDVMRSFECWLNLVNRLDGQTKFELLELILSLAKFVWICLCICVRRVLYAPFLQLLPFAWTCMSIQIGKYSCYKTTVHSNCVINNSSEYKKECHTHTHNSPRKTTASTVTANWIAVYNLLCVISSKWNTRSEHKTVHSPIDHWKCRMPMCFRTLKRSILCCSRKWTSLQCTINKHAEHLKHTFSFMLSISIKWIGKF